MHNTSLSAAHRLFAATLDLYRNHGEVLKHESSEQHIQSAFRSAIKQLNSVEKADFNEFMKWVGTYPASSEGNLQHHRMQQRELDVELNHLCKQLALSGEIITQEDFLLRTGKDEVWLQRKLKQKRMFCVHMPLYETSLAYIPSFFLHPMLDIQAIENVSKRLGNLEGITKLRFFRSPLDNHIKRSPIELVLGGQHQYVMEAATQFKNFVEG